VLADQYGDDPFLVVALLLAGEHDLVGAVDALVGVVHDVQLSDLLFHRPHSSHALAGIERTDSLTLSWRKSVCGPTLRHPVGMRSD
jgi:hypothetical protein